MICKHPAKFTDALIPKMAEMLIEFNHGKILDPFAGTGKIALIKQYGFCGEIYANEIEKDWIIDNIYGCDFITVQDAEFLNYPNNFFDAICTSPTYGNRMADYHHAKDGSKRMTYYHCLGHELQDGNTGKMQFGNQYMDKHINIYNHLYSLIIPGGVYCKY